MSTGTFFEGVTGGFNTISSCLIALTAGFSDLIGLSVFFSLEGFFLSVPVLNLANSSYAVCNLLRAADN